MVNKFIMEAPNSPDESLYQDEESQQEEYPENPTDYLLSYDDRHDSLKRKKSPELTVIDEPHEPLHKKKKCTEEFSITKLRPDAVFPRRQHTKPYRFHLLAPTALKIPAQKFVDINTGLRIQRPEGYKYCIGARHDLTFTYNISLVYTPLTTPPNKELVLRMINTGNFNVRIAPRTPIAQLSIYKPAPTVKVVRYNAVSSNDDLASDSD